ncbi:GNAT family acetyltransferase [Ancylobacter sp. 6x-1]|uniref:GNAT family acetyltransferase n=1 Tax=Ancylobacter crimeensis TaxID=2579147 RepID=A0ABT0DC35_9HYPH|nr:GNAT family acetyltransferase [Ancylobacter crimeensis]MCK0197515.1 GNAT family acetyltransferase [Ancylobacter crimeensis]
MSFVIRMVFAVSAVALMLVAATLLVTVPVQVAGWTFAGEVPPHEAMLDVVGYLIVALALFDVAKYFFEEEVPAGREKRTPADARRGLTKFVSTIIIAIFLEALLLTFETARDDMTRMIYPVMLLGTGCAALLTLGAFQRLSAAAERDVGPAEAERDRRDAPRI